MLNPQAVEFLQQKYQSDHLLKLAQQQLSAFSESEDFWNQFDAAFGTEYDRSIALKVRSQWQTGDFSQFPEVEIVSSSNLGNDNASYDASTNRIYLSDSFVNTATTKTVINTLLKEYGNFVGDRIDSRSVRVGERGNNADPERGSFATLVEGSNLDNATIPASAMRCNCQLCQRVDIDLNDVFLPALTAKENLATIGGRSFGALQSIVPSSNDSRINALLGGYKWGGTTITYSFYGGGTYYGSETGIASVSEGVKQNVRDFLTNAIQPLINVNFEEVSDSAASYGQLRYLTSPDAGYAYAYYPFSTDANQGNSNDLAGDIFLDPDYDNTSSTNGFQGGLGNHGYTTLIHETLHALGLKHPGNYNGGGTGTGPFLPFAQDNLDNTVMTYNFGGASPGTPMAYDLLALQYLYGARSFNTSNTTYTFTQTDLYSDGIKTTGTATKDTKLTIWDTAGIDTLDFSALAVNAGGYRFDLNQGGWLTTQAAFNGSTGTALGDTTPGTIYSMTTAGTRLGFGVDIEKATGTSSNDLFYGNSLDNYFYGKLGSDTLYGGGGNDVAIYAGTSAQYNITSVGGLFTITDSIANRDGIDTLDSIESIQFSDTTIALISSTLPTLSIDNVSIVEGNSGTKNAVFTVTRSGTATTAISVTYTTADGTATAGIDFTSITGLLTFAVNETTKTISIPILGDTNIEGNEIFFINLSNPINATIADAQGQGTIENDDPVTISNDNFVNRYTLTGNIASATGNNVSATGEVGELSHAGASTPINSLWWTWTATANGNVTISTAGSNFDTTLGVYTGSSVSSLTTIASNDDASGTTLASLVTFAAVSGTSYQIAVDGFNAATGNINLALDFTPTLANITLVQSPSSVNEDGMTNLVYTFTRTGSLTNALTVNYGVGGTATFNTDYTQLGAASFGGTTGTITFAANSATATLTIDPKADTIFESNETVAITLAAGTDYTVDTTTAVTGTIANDDSSSVITLVRTPSSVDEDGTTNIIYTFKRTGVTTNALTVNYGVAGSAAFNTDYTQLGAASFGGTTGTITFAANSATATLTIDPTADTIFESNETVAITLAAGTDYTVGTTTAVTGTIKNDENGITLVRTPSSVNEDGTTNIIYTFTRSGSITNALTVNYGVGGTATFNTDYTQLGAASFGGTTGTITFAANSATATLTIDPNADTLLESNETVAITLAAGTGYTVVTTTAVTGTIINDETAITLSIAPSSVYEDGTTNLIYTFKRTGITTNALTVNYGVAGSAAFNTDYTQLGAASFGGTTGTITFAANSATATLTIDPTADTIFESNETVAITLAAGTGYTVGTTTAVTGTIRNDDAIVLSIPSGNVNTVDVLTGQNLAIPEIQSETSFALPVAAGEVSNPVVIANRIFENYLDLNSLNQVTSDIFANSNYLGTNSDRVDLFGLLGDNRVVGEQIVFAVSIN
jgi:hypothetical protein